MNRMGDLEKPEFIPVLVAPLYQGNIGSIARLARNFGMTRMAMIDPPELQDEAIAYSMHGKDILLSSKVYGSLAEASMDLDFLVGTSGISDSGEKCYQRNPVTLDEMIRWSRTISGKVGLVFGREDRGLLREEIKLCDMMVTVTASPDYPILNLSHSAGIIFYELWAALNSPIRRNSPTISVREKNALLQHYERLMEISGVPEHKRPIARTNFRRMVSRAAPSKREFNSLMGTFSRAMDYKRKRKEE
ncbi:MAG: RNA methyltransferase [Candidatus Thermoplasmatota archaeon]|nr:RNA methyltransferase [Candidatus Thermoplasmatota archaeon]